MATAYFFRGFQASFVCAPGSSLANDGSSTFEAQAREMLLLPHPLVARLAPAFPIYLPSDDRRFFIAWSKQR